MSKKLSIDELISEMNRVHKNRYSYPFIPADYKVNRQHIDIVCPIHGTFKQSIYHHRKGQGCPKCGKIRQRYSKKISRDEWIRRFEEVHGKRNYDYSRMPDKVGQYTKIEIYCPTHDITFYREPESHWRHGQGCPKCNKLLNAEARKNRMTERLNYEKAARLKNGFDFEYTELPLRFSLNDSIILYCNKHNRVFYCNADEHLKGKGCPECPTLIG